MKVYVDKLPNDCALCPFWARYVDPDYDELFYCKFDDSEENLDCLKHDEKNCPLKSLKDHDKQVRKEVCEEIKAKLKLKEIHHTEVEIDDEYDYYYKEDVEVVLDQIQD